MSYFDDASLVMIPSGYKTSKVYSVKPTDGTGDLAFTRSNDTATRVASNGLIEKVRTNLVLQSQAFNTASWTTTRATITANQAVAPDGTTTADLFTDGTFTSTNCFSDQAVSTSGTYNMSGFVKAGTSPFIALILYDDQDNGVLFNTSTQAITTFGTVTNEKVESVGNGWYRISFARTVSAATSFAGISVRPTNSIGPYNGTSSLTALFWGVQVETGDIATDYIATTTAAVSVGPVANVPRLDYLNSSCPRLLLEPQRTNNALYSEQLDNAAWTKQNTTVTANAITSPSGYQDADKLIETSATGAHRASVSSAATLNGTFSFFAKAGERTKVAILSTTIDLGFDLSNGTLIDLGSGTSAGKIENYGNGWYRCSLPQASGIVALALALLDNANTISYAGNGTSGAYFWGAQLELGAYATSYIPTLGAAVTRGADAASKTGISSLIGQTEGTLFFDVTLDSRASSTWFVVAPNLAAGDKYIGIQIGSSVIQAEVADTTPQAVISFTNSSTGRFKAALAYKANDFVFYVNGTLVGTDTSGTVPACSALGLYNYAQTTSVKYNQALLFPTRLSNSELAALTA